MTIDVSFVCLKLTLAENYKQWAQPTHDHIHRRQIAEGGLD
jgi:hypothetical protein